MTAAGAAASVIVPSYGRPGLLLHCLRSLIPSMRQCDEAVVVLRPGDLPSWEVVAQFSGMPRTVRAVAVAEPGMWPALMTGLADARNDIVAFLDDDALPMPTWVAEVATGFNDPSVGGFGGPILNFEDVRTENRFVVDGPIAHVDRRGVPRSQLHGWTVGHVVEDVDFLPGSNMAFRKQLVAGLRNLTLPAMAPGNELVFASAVRSRGFRLVFDSNIKVEHHPGPRTEHARDDKILYASSYAYTITIALRSQPLVGRTANALLGSRVAPGLLTLPFCAAKGRHMLRRWQAASGGRRAAARDLRRLGSTYP